MIQKFHQITALMLAICLSFGLVSFTESSVVQAQTQTAENQTVIQVTTANTESITVSVERNDHCDFTGSISLSLYQPNDCFTLIAESFRNNVELSVVNLPNETEVAVDVGPSLQTETISHRSAKTQPGVLVSTNSLAGLQKDFTNFNTETAELNIAQIQTNAYQYSLSELQVYRC